MWHQLDVLWSVVFCYQFTTLINKIILKHLYHEQFRVARLVRVEFVQIQWFLQTELELKQGLHSG